MIIVLQGNNIYTTQQEKCKCTRVSNLCTIVVSKWFTSQKLHIMHVQACALLVHTSVQAVHKLGHDMHFLACEPLGHYDSAQIVHSCVLALLAVLEELLQCHYKSALATLSIVPMNKLMQLRLLSVNNGPAYTCSYIMGYSNNGKFHIAVPSSRTSQLYKSCSSATRGPHINQMVTHCKISECDWRGTCTCMIDV